jgi:hypothetical protein
MKIDSYLSGFLLIGGSTLAAVAGLLIVRRVLHSKNLISSHDVGGYLLSVVGTMYAVILGLIVVDAMTRFQEARQNTERESNALANILLLSNQLPHEKKVQIQRLGLAYVERVLVDEWPILDYGQFAPEARRTALDLIDAVSSFEPQTAKEAELYAAGVGAACELWNARRTRINTAMHGVPALEWVVLLVGGVVTVSFTYFFKLEHLPIQVVMTAMVAVVIALCLFLVLMFGYPFSGELKVDPSNFRVAEAIVKSQNSRTPMRSP